MPKYYLSTSLKEAVVLRASNCCEYFKSQDKYAPTSFTIEHIIPESLDGTSIFENLAYACFLCNRLKPNKLKTFDELSKKWVPLFNPRTDNWDEHFAWNQDATLIIGITIIGRCCVKELKLNREKLIEYLNVLFHLEHIHQTHPKTNSIERCC